MGDTDRGQPALRVERGTATDEELAALTVVLLALGRVTDSERTKPVGLFTGGAVARTVCSPWRASCRSWSGCRSVGVRAGCQVAARSGDLAGGRPSLRRAAPPLEDC
ncbi:acyl-CoA carboxylase subunit epsilon [Streptomyces sp. NPDC001393]